MNKSIPRKITNIALVFLALLFSGCSDTGKAPKIEKQNPLWSKYISAHTSGVVSRKSKIQIHFVNDIIEKDLIGKDAASYVNVSPSIDGSIVFISRNQIDIIPKTDLKQGQHYIVTIKKDKLGKTSDDLDDYKFVLQVVKQQFEVSIIGLNASPKNDQIMALKGKLDAADVIDTETIKKMVQANADNKKLKISWKHLADNKRFEFTVHGIKRSKETGKIILSWDGSSHGIDNKGSRDIEVPAISIFKVTDVKAIQAEKQYILVHFSDNLKRNQNLRGLVRLNKKHFVRIEGNKIKIYPSNKFIGKINLTLEPNIKNYRGARLKKRFKDTVIFTSQKPQIRFVGKGVILPGSKVLSIPFEAINVRSVQVTAFQVYSKNIGQFLQNNKLDSTQELHRVGRYLWRKTVHFSSIDPDKWNRYDIDVTKLMRDNPGGLFRITLSINRSNSSYSCSETENRVSVVKEIPFSNSEDHNVKVIKEPSAWDNYESSYNPNQNSTEWKDRNNPCQDAYFKHAKGIKGSRNFLGSNIGMLAKRGQDGYVHFVTTNLLTAEPLKGVDIEVFNFQNHSMAATKTDGDGFAKVKVAGTPFYSIAKLNNDVGYLKMNAGTALSISHFDVGGVKLKAGIKGFMYGERGVWRPGDKIHLVFALEDKNDVIPEKHPVTLRLYNPKGQLIKSVTNSTPVGDFYRFDLKTRDDAPTGSWTVKTRIGGSIFSKILKIEAIKPNRLKVELDFGKKTLYQSDMPLKGKIFGQWLHGATAAGLNTDVTVQFRKKPTKFSRYSDYIFDDPARELKSEPEKIYDGALNADGKVNFNTELTSDVSSPGMLTAHFTTRVFEKGGDFSSSRTSFPYYPYEKFIGIKLPKGDRTRGMLLTDKKHTVSIASLSPSGKPVSIRQVQVNLYKISWKWWWDKSGESLAQYASADHTSSIAEGTIATKNGRGEWKFEVKYPQWGRYLVRACDPGGGHCTGKIVYIDWPGWAGRAQKEKGPGASVLNFFSDKAAYKVGEKAIIQLPEASQGRALVTVENGSRLIEQRWVEFSKGKTKFELDIKKEMSPNVYVNVTLLQPHQNKKNDRPIRLFGIIPIKVKDPGTKLTPIIKAKNEWAPLSMASVSVSEKNGKPMTYTLAVVDEGLLGLTSFKTPNLHKQFYKKEALGVTTWDLFDFVVGAYGGKLERLLAIGGGGEVEKEDKHQDKKRFPPVVKFLGPFNLEAGKTKQHKFKLPQYVGAVRVMVVSGKKGAYGHADKSVFVRSPLTLLATLPRVIGPDEELTVPVSLFVMDKSIKNVTLNVNPDSHFRVIGSKSVKVRFTKPGDKIGFVKLKVRSRLGKGKLQFVATSGKFRSESVTYIDIRSPNPETTNSLEYAIKPGDSWAQKVTPHGIAGTNTVSIEISSIPPLSLEKRMGYLIRYPHGCLEQTTSSVFPQLYLSSLVKLDDANKAKIEKNVNSGIDRLRQFQSSHGGFAYWPGGFASSGAVARNSWTSSYAGHFLLEAKKKGYFVPDDMLTGWVKQQKNIAQSWTSHGQHSEMNQAYRLYTLALAGEPEIGAMNRLRESGKLHSTAKWLLAAAYKLSGQSDVANTLIKGSGFSVIKYITPGWTFGSSLRDRAIILNTLTIMGKHGEAKDLAQKISDDLAKNRWHSTQSVAYSLLAMSKYIGSGDTASFTFERSIGNGKPIKIKNKTPIYKSGIDNFPINGETIKIKNKSDRVLFASIITKGIPAAGKETASSAGFSIDVDYTDTSGNPIDISSIKQGSDFVATIRISNQTRNKINNIALSHIVPSGWEIRNNRLDSGGADEKKDIDYQDIRDDRIYTYFSLMSGNEITIKSQFNATYLGNYYLPGISVEAMYDASKHARLKGQRVRVIKKTK